MSKLTYSVEEIKQQLNIKHTKLYSLINSGQLKAHKIGTRTIFKAESVEAYLSSLPEAA